MLELTTRSRRRATRNRRTVVQLASLLLLLIALSFVVPAAAGVAFHTVTDNAMSGTMGKGSAVVVESVPVADLKLGDIITYQKTPPDGPFITRRIAGIEGDVFQTMGDGAGSLDPWTVTLDGSTQDVVVTHVPYAGYVVDLLDGPVRVWLAGLLVGLVVAVLVGGARATRRDGLTAAGTHVPPVAGDGTPARRTRVPAARRSRETRRDTTV